MTAAEEFVKKQKELGTPMFAIGGGAGVQPEPSQTFETPGGEQFQEPEQLTQENFEQRFQEERQRERSRAPQQAQPNLQPNQPSAELERANRNRAKQGLEPIGQEQLDVFKSEAPSMAETLMTVIPIPVGIISVGGKAAFKAIKAGGSTMEQLITKFGGRAVSEAWTAIFKAESKVLQKKVAGKATVVAGKTFSGGGKMESKAIQAATLAAVETFEKLAVQGKAVATGELGKAEAKSATGYLKGSLGTAIGQAKEEVLETTAGKWGAKVTIDTAIGSRIKALLVKAVSPMIKHPYITLGVTAGQVGVGYWGKAEGIKDLSFHRDRAIELGNYELAGEINAILDEALNEPMWMKIMAWLPLIQTPITVKRIWTEVQGAKAGMKVTDEKIRMREEGELTPEEQKWQGRIEEAEARDAAKEEKIARRVKESLERDAEEETKWDARIAEAEARKESDRAYWEQTMADKRAYDKERDKMFADLAEEKRKAYEERAKSRFKWGLL